MKQTDLADLKSLLKQYRKARTALRLAIRTKKPAEDLKQNRREILSQMKPGLITLWHDSESLPAFFRIVVRSYYRGKSARDIADSFEVTEQYIFKVIKQAERKLVEHEQ